MTEVSNKNKKPTPKFKGTLIVGKWYRLKYTKEFCHCVGKHGIKQFSNNMNQSDRVDAMFIGTAPCGYQGQYRNMFFSIDKDRMYISFGTDEIYYVVKQIEDLEI
jgi:hypothetical protein